MSTLLDQKEKTVTLWKPHPGPQTEAFRWFYVDEILYGGAKGGGKTDWLLFDFIEPELINNSRYRGIIFRRTFSRLREIIDRSHQWFSRFENPPKYSGDDKSWIFPSGAKLAFAHCQHEEDKYDYQGHEYQYMGFDQLEEFTETQYSFLKAQVRTSDSTIKTRIRATANPGNIGHLWVKRKFIDSRKPMQIYKNKHGITSMFIPAKVYDNLTLMKNDPMYIKRLEDLPEQDRRALLEGDWNIFAGQYFKEWRNDIHVIEPIYLPQSWHRFIAGDYGFKKPSSVGWYAVDQDGVIYRYREIYGDGYYYDTLADKICDLSEGEEIDYMVFDPAIFGDKQHHKEAREGNSGAEIMQTIINDRRQDKAFTVVRGDNRRMEGWANVRKYLKDGMFKVFSTCVKFIETFPSNTHDEHKPEDLNSDGEDHSADEGRYGLMSKPLAVDIYVEKEPPVSSPAGRMRSAKSIPNSFVYAR